MNRVFYNTMISSSDREAAYVADAFLNNLSIKTNIHSTDTHGYSESIFCILHMLGIYFAPRIKNFKKAILYGFEQKKVYESKGYRILPQCYIDEEAINQHWDDILRLMVTLKLKETTASQIFKRLSSYSKQHPLYCAIKEFGHIMKSLFLLRYIDDLLLRQAIEKQLNRIELSNKFSIVLWNELYLSQKLAMITEEDKRKALLDSIKNGSTLSWRHVNFGGEYDFTQEIEQYPFDLEQILALEVTT